MKRWHGLLLGVVVSAAAMYVAVQGVRFDQVVQSVVASRYGYVLAVVPLIAVATYLRGVTWSILLGRRISALRGFWLFNTGALFNNILPFRMGEFARAYIVSRQPDLRFAQALSSIIVERLIDLFSVVLLLTILLQLPLLSVPQWASSAALLLGGGVAVGMLTLFVAARNTEWVLSVARRLLSRISLAGRLDAERLTAQLESFLEGLAALRDLKVILAAVAVSWLGWIVAGVTAWLLLLAFDNIEQNSIEVGFLAIAAAGLGIALPSLPGAVGPFEAVVKLTLVAVGISNESALSYALVLHAINFVTTSALGAIGLLNEGLTFGDVARVARQKRGQTPRGRIVEIESKSVSR